MIYACAMKINRRNI